jgi:hypothetical protein
MLVVTTGLPGTALALGSTLVLPLQAVGVDSTTALVVADLLRGELEARGILVLGVRAPGTALSPEAACQDAPCASAVASAHGASVAVYGSLSRLGEKIIVRSRAVRVGEAVPFFADQLASATEEDLDALVRRIAAGIAEGRPNADTATVDTVTREESRRPARRATRKGLGLRAGFLFPVADSYGGASQLTNLRLAYRREAREFMIETTTLLGLAWSEDTQDWTILDVFAARLFGAGDIAPYLGAGIGVHAVNVRYQDEDRRPYGEYGVTYEQSKTTLTADLGVGVVALRTYDVAFTIDVRYHHVFSEFDEVGGDGARGFAVTFGTTK